MKIELVRLACDGRVGDREKAAAVDVFAGSFAAIDEEMDAAFRRFLNRALFSPAGNTFSLEWRFPRSPEFHRAHFKLVSNVFKSQESFVHMNTFRAWLKLGSAFVDFVPSPETGVLTPVPKSIAYEALEDEAFRDHHKKVVAFLRSPRATSMLWPHLNVRQQAEAIERFLEE